MMETLETIARNPSGWDSESNYIGAPLAQFNSLYVVMTRNRDSGLLTECNWEEALRRLGGESENVIVHRFGHWACGWWEALCVTQAKYNEGNAIVKELEDYPVLNEDQFSEREYEAAQEYWEQLSLRERVELCQKADVSIFSARYGWIPQDDSGYIFERCRPE